MTYTDVELEIKIKDDLKVIVPISRLTNPEKILGGVTVHLDVKTRLITIVDSDTLIEANDEIFDILKDF